MGGKRNLMPYVLSLGVLVLVWKGAAVLVASPILVPPEEVLKSFLKACATADFWGHFGISTYRVVAGIVLGWMGGFPAGVLLGYSVQTDRILGPLVFMTYPIPKIVLLPLILLFFGLGDLSKIVLIFIIVFFQILMTTRDGARGIDQKYFDSLCSLGAGDRVVLREVVVPASLPASFTALRIGIGTAISILFFVESFATTSGLGYIIMDAWARMDYAGIFVGIVGMSLLGVLLYEVLNVLESRVCAWKFAAREEALAEAPLPDRARKLAVKTVVYGRMIKFSHTVFALPFAFAALLLAQRESPITFGLLFWIVVAMIGARSAAMGFNRVVDAPLDARNPRTAGREIPAGLLSRREAFLFITGSSLVFVLASGFISATCFLCSFVVLGLLFGYSYTKRFTWLSHLVLGVVIGLAPLGVWVAVTDSLSGRIAVLSLVLATYIAGFDILYACQDVEFDRKEGLYSMPVRFGVQASMRFSAILHALTFLSLLSLYWIFSLSPVFIAFAVAIGILLVVEHRLVKPQDLTRIDIAFYHVNSIISVLIFLALVAEELMRRVF
jgi:4-hydroxybenzoate polyprenyltransferase